MALLEIPTVFDGTPHYRQRTKLDGIDYIFRFRFGFRRQAWVFDMRTIDGGGEDGLGEEIVVGQLVTIGRDLLRRSVATQKPPGVLFALNLQAPLRELPGLYDLGDSCRLYYEEAATVVAAGVGT